MKYYINIKQNNFSISLFFHFFHLFIRKIVGKILQFLLCGFFIFFMSSKIKKKITIFFGKHMKWKINLLKKIEMESEKHFSEPNITLRFFFLNCQRFIKVYFK